LAVDPNIPLQSVYHPIDPMVTLGHALTLRNLGQQGQLQQQHLQENQQAIDEQNALRAAVQQNTTTDPTSGETTTDHAGVMAQLAKGGNAAGLMKYRDDVSRLKTAEFQRQQEQLKAANEVTSLIASKFGAATDQPSWDAAKTATRATLQRVAPQSVGQIDQIGDYSPAAQQQLVTEALTAAQHTNFLREAGNDARLAAEHAATLPGKTAKSQQEVRANAAGPLAVAADTDFRTYQNAYHQLPDEVSAQFPAPEKWTEDTGDQIRALGQTPNEQQTTINTNRRLDANQEASDARLKISRDRLRLEQAKFDRDPSRNDPAYRRDFDEYKTYLRQYDAEANSQRNTDPLTGIQTRVPITPAPSFKDWRAKEGRTAPAGTPDSPTSTSKTVTVAELQKIATQNGTTVDAERERAIKAGYAVVR
jgi:hypothetical protein